MRWRLAVRCRRRRVVPMDRRGHNERSVRSGRQRGQDRERRCNCKFFYHTFYSKQGRGFLICPPKVTQSMSGRASSSSIGAKSEKKLAVQPVAA